MDTTREQAGREFLRGLATQIRSKYLEADAIITEAAELGVELEPLPWREVDTLVGDAPVPGSIIFQMRNQMPDDPDRVKALATQLRDDPTLKFAVYLRAGGADAQERRRRAIEALAYHRGVPKRWWRGIEL